MGQFTKTTFSDDDVLTHSDLNDIQDDIITAHNTHATGDFPSDCVPVAAVVNDNSTFTIPLTHVAAVGNSVAYTDQLGEGVGFTPMAFTLVSVTAVSTDVTSACDVKLYYDGSAASSAMSLTTDYTGVKDSAPSVTSFAASKLLEIRVETGVGGDALGITVLLECKKQHVG